MAPPQHYPSLPREETLASLPAEYPTDTQDQISQILATSPINRLVVLDDDPTGTQTCHDINVLAVWDIPTLVTEFETNSPGFFILTNSRALPPSEAETLIRTICTNVASAAKSTGNKVDIVLRGDSTLRGHFPLEPDVAQSVFGVADGLVLAPFFFQGGRFTIDDVHYVAEGDQLVPAGETQFAKDATFGYKSSNLRDYVQEKAPGRFSKEQLYSVTINEIRQGGPEAVCAKLLDAPAGGVIIANAAAESDMHVFVAGLLLGMSPLYSTPVYIKLTLPAESKGKHFLYRTGAAFVSTRLGIRSKAPITATQLQLPSPRQTGGLIIAGSYVPKTTAQLKVLTDRRGAAGQLAVIEIKVEDLVASPQTASDTIARVVKETETYLAAGRDTLVMTSRKLITGGDKLSSLKIGSVVAETLVSVLQRIEVRPRYIIAKVCDHDPVNSEVQAIVCFYADLYPRVVLPRRMLLLRA